MFKNNIKKEYYKSLENDIKQDVLKYNWSGDEVFPEQKI